MAIIYTWGITALQALGDNVVQASWTYTGTDGDLTDCICDTVAIPPTPLVGLEEAKAIALVKTALAKAIPAFESDLAKSINKQNNPMAETVDLPWVG